CNKRGHHERMAPNLQTPYFRLRRRESRQRLGNFIDILVCDDFPVRYIGDLFEYFGAGCFADGLDGGALNEERRIERGAGLFAGKRYLMFAWLGSGEMAAKSSPFIAH